MRDRCNIPLSKAALFAALIIPSLVRAAPSACDDPRLPAHQQCWAEEIPFYASGWRTTGWFVRLMTGYAASGDVVGPRYMDVAVLPGQEVIVLSRNGMFALSMELMFEDSVGLRGRGLQPGRRKTPFGLLFDMEARSEGDLGCVFYVAKFPFRGRLGHCADDSRPNSVRLAPGVLDIDGAHQVASAALQDQFGLSTKNPEHLEVPLTAFDVLHDQGEWFYRFTFDGRRRLLPYHSYDVDIRVDGTLLRVLQRPWTG